jgi:carbon monoxide dehydrogenase subunit G
MPFSVETICKTSFQTTHSVDQIMEFLSDYDNSVGNQFDGLESFKLEGHDSYRWTFESINYGSYHLQITFLTKFKKKDPQTLEIIPIKGDDKAIFSGCWKLKPNKDGTLVTFEAKLVGELPLPGLMKGMITPLAQKEVTKLFNRYVENVSKSL